MAPNSWKGFDHRLFLLTVVICLTGLVLLYSASYQKSLACGINFVGRQATWAAFGIICLLITARINYRKLIEVSYILYAFNLLLLVLVLLLGHVKMGAQRWLSFGSFTFQPSELAKIIIILVLAKYLGGTDLKIQPLKKILISLSLVAVPLILILKQPDLGTAMVFLPIFFSMLYIRGLRLKYLLGLVMVGLASTPLLWFLLRDYQRQRLLVFLNPNIDPLGSGYTVIQSKIAIGSGGFLGKGWLAGTQNQLNFLPEHHTDFIFSVIGEEWGFLGATILILLYFLLIRQGLKIAGRTNDSTGRLLAVGIITMFSFHIIVNIGMTVGMMPVTGLPLPLLSYGGSCLVMTMMSIGILLNIRMKRTIF
ncbi:MAG: rod shape-determining protein RodA [Candidatus Omnitrophota bacterium]|nr:rod shape-determining protein RodA [Candidatus Omnitrophota bacterium]